VFLILDDVIGLPKGGRHRATLVARVLNLSISSEV